MTRYLGFTTREQRIATRCLQRYVAGDVVLLVVEAAATRVGLYALQRSGAVAGTRGVCSVGWIATRSDCRSELGVYVGP